MDEFNNSVYFSGDHYDSRTGYFQEDLPFWKTMAHRYDGPILELACGTGRVSIPLATEGFPVVGIDVSSSMLDRGKQKAPAELDIQWILGDIRHFDVGRKFPLVIFPFNALCHLITWQDFGKTLGCVKKHLQDEGKLILDVFNPSLELLSRPSNKRYGHSIHSHPTEKATIKAEETSRYDTTTQVNHVRIFYNQLGVEDVEETLTMRIYYPQELEALLHYNGFELIERWGDYSLAPFESTSPKQLMVAQLNNSPQ